MTEGLTNSLSGLVALFLTVYWLVLLVLRRRKARRKASVPASSMLPKRSAAAR